MVSLTQNVRAHLRFPVGKRNHNLAMTAKSVTAYTSKFLGGNAMKKILAIVLALAMVLSLAACGAKAPAGPKVSVFWYDEADVYLSTVRSELNKALETAGLAYDNQYAGKDQAKQLEQIKTAIAGGTTLQSRMEEARCLCC